MRPCSLDSSRDSATHRREPAAPRHTAQAMISGVTPLPRLPAELVPKIPAPVQQGVPARGAARLRAHDSAAAAAAGLPDHRGAEGGDNCALRVPALASRDHRAFLQGGQLLRPSLRARGGLVSRAPPAWPRLWAVKQRHRRRCGPLVGEASPSYLFHPEAARRVGALMPRAKLIAVLRNPAEPRVLRITSTRWRLAARSSRSRRRSTPKAVG